MANTSLSNSKEFLQYPGNQPAFPLADFTDWLINRGYKVNTVQSIVSRINRIKEKFPELDRMILDGQAESLLEKFDYSRDEYNSGKQPAHGIVISGDLYNGTVSLRQALKLYITFIQQIHPQTFLDKKFAEIRNTIKNFQFQLSTSKVNVAAEIQNPLLAGLKKSMPEINWDKEVNLSEKFPNSVAGAHDRADILGLDTNNNYMVIIELDNNRADQVSKKFVSRIAITLGYDVIYISLCYTNHNSAEKSGKKEVTKYVSYINEIMMQLDGVRGHRKLYGHINIYK